MDRRWVALVRATYNTLPVVAQYDNLVVRVPRFAGEVGCAGRDRNQVGGGECRDPGHRRGDDGRAGPGQGESAARWLDRE